MHGQRQHFLRCMFSLWQAIVVAEIFYIKCLFVDWNGIIHLGADSILIQVCAQGIPLPARNTDSILMKNMGLPFRHVRRSDSLEVVTQEFGVRAALGVELLEF